MFIMANNEKFKNMFEREKQKIDELVTKRDQLFIERDNISSTGSEKREKIRTINAEIKTLNHELSEIGRELVEKNTSLPEELKKLTKIKGKKVLVNYEINGEKLTAHVVSNSRGKFNNIASEINLNNQLLAYFKETVTIKENGIVSQFKIDEEAILKMSLEEKLQYYNELCAKISNPDIVRDPAKSVTLGKRYCLVNECDLEVYIDCLNRYIEALVELETQKKDYTRLQAVQILANQTIKVDDVELSSFHIDWNLVNSFETLEEKAEYFNNLAKEIAAAPKTDTTKVPLGKSFATINKCDEMIFLQCFNEYRKAQRAILASKKPKYTIDWDYVNSLDSAIKRAEYFEDLCGRIDALEKFETVIIPFRNHTFVINKVDEEVFKEAMHEFEKNYLQAIKEKRQAEIARAEEQKRKEEEAREALRIEEEKKKEEARLEQERLEKERLEQILAEEKRLEEERAREAKEAELRELEKLAKEEESQKDDLVEQNAVSFIADAADKEKHRQERDEDLEEECLFIGTNHQDRVGDAASTLDELSEIEADGDEEIDFFDDDEEDVTLEDGEDTRQDEATEEPENADNIQKTAEALDGEVINIDGLEIVDLSPEDKVEDSEEKDKENQPEDKKKRSLKDTLGGLIKGKKGKKKNNKEHMAVYENATSSDAVEFDIADEDTLKVLASRGYIGNVSESKLYTIKKELYLCIMDWIVDQKIINKVIVETKRHTAQIDAKYEDIYKFIATRYENLEDRYERYAADKYHDLKVKLSICAGTVACGTVLLLTAGRGLLASSKAADEVNAITNQIKYEVEQDTSGTIINAPEYDALHRANAMLIEIEENLKLPSQEEDNLEQEVSPLSSSENTTPSGETSTNMYTNRNSLEAFNIDPSKLGIAEEDATDEVKRSAQTNKAPLYELVR